MHRFEGAERYAEGALRLLQFVEARRPTARRFGPDADARWASFRGDLATTDRIELMIRDADAEWPGGFGARVVYAMPGVAEDDPFGGQWKGLDPVRAEELWRRLKDVSPPRTASEILREIASVWSVKLARVNVDAVSANDRIVVVGASAIAAVIETFSSGSGLDWAEQVVVVATPPHARQLGAAATAILNRNRAGKILTADQAKFEKPIRARLVSSDDADGGDRDAAGSLAGA